jgi:dihydrofolate synthase/folylpolyglutamate synthase
MKPGLGRIEGVLNVLAEPQRSAPAIHIAGTNGKGSTARLAAAILDRHGLKTGLFTSPHLQRLEQRYEVGGEVMTAAELAAAVTDLGPVVELYERTTGDGVTYFEMTTALAFAWFAERAVDVMVIETGLGGRLDATNVLDADVAVVTTIGLDHSDQLGDTIPAIAAEKLAILAAGATLVTGDLPDDALVVAERRVADQGASWLRWGADFGVASADRAVQGWLLDVGGVHAAYDEIYLSLHGRHQSHNLAVAIAATEAFFGRALDDSAVREAAATAAHPGRMELVAAEPPVLLDGAHNAHGMAALAEALREEFSSLSWTLVFGGMADKDVTGMLRLLDGAVTRVHACAVDDERAMDPSRVAEAAAAALDVPADAHDSVAGAVSAARSSGGPVLVTGSLYLVGEVRTLFGVE